MNTSATAMYGWDHVGWPKLERGVFKLQKRIYQASCKGDIRLVHRLQRLLLKSRGAAFVAVCRVTEVNDGKRTAGIDGLSSLSESEKLVLAEQLVRDPLQPKCKPVRRVWIPKPGTEEKRPLGIPVMEDRARQALVKLALEPEWEAKFEPNSYGFRPGRSCHDAVQAIFLQIQQCPKFVLDADIAKCFDRINHEALLTKLGTFPELRRVIKAWLQAGVMDGNHLFPTEEGTPQGGVISPLLANIALHGLAATIEDAFPKHKELPTGRAHWTPVVIRYADDFVVIHRDREVIDRVREIAAEWLKDMGLEMKPSKTRITHTLDAIDGSAGFDFLGFHFRQYERGKNHSVRDGMGRMMGFVPQVRPSATSQKRLLLKVREVLHAHRAWEQEAVIGKLNPILRGWGRYFSIGVSSKVFHKMDHLIFKKLWAWARRRHPNKSRSWVASAYWPFQNPRWTFGTKGGFKLHLLSDIPIRRHIKVKEDRSPFDGDGIYWGTRMGRHADLPWGVGKLLKQQRGICPSCALYFKYGDRLVRLSRQSSAPDGKPRKTPVVLHEHCQHVIPSIEVCDDNTPLD